MSAAVIGVDWVGRSIDGRFSLLEWLGGTQESGVYLTELSEPPQKAIIKLVPAHSKQAEMRMTAWRAAPDLSHPNLIRVIESGRCEIDSVALLYVLTEFADEVLAKVLLERPLTPQETREMLSPALGALAWLHGKGFVHGRLKPSNIMAVGDRLKLSADGVLLAGAIGKPSLQRTVYDAPETLYRRIGTAADVWSLGATLVAVLTQHPPAWDRASDVDPVVPESIPQPFATMARECLRIDPARRCTLEQIETYLLPGKVLPRLPGKAGETSPPKGRVAALIAAVAILLAGIGYVVSHQSRPPQSAPEEENEQATRPASAPPTASAPARTPPQAAPPTLTSTPVSTPGPEPTPDSAAAPPLPPIRNAQSPEQGSTTMKSTVTHRVEPDVPASALETISGTVLVTVRIEVDAAGNVTDAAFQSAGPSRYFANLALDAARHWKFKPARVDGRAVPGTWLLDFQFRQSGIDITPIETVP